MTPFPSWYEQLGGEDVVRAIADRFYDRMDTLPEAREVRAMHPDDLTSSRDKLFWFLSGWLGGPNLYVERHGHPRLRMRHLPFSIGTDARDQWLLCMEHALADVGVADELAGPLMARFTAVADHMRNRPGA